MSRHKRTAMKSGLDLMKTMLKYHGLWPERGKTTWRHHLRAIYPRVGLMAVLLRLFIVHLMDVYFSWGHVLNVCESGIIAFLSLVTVVKSGTLLFQKHKVKALFHNLEKIEKINDLTNDVIRKMREESLRFSDKALKYYYVVVILLGTISAVSQLPEAIANRTMQDRGWYPYDEKVSPIYELTLAFYTLSIIVVLNLQSLCDLTLVLLLIHIVRQYKILRYNLQNIKKHATKKPLKQHYIEIKTVMKKPEKVMKPKKVRYQGPSQNFEQWKEIRRVKMNYLLAKSKYLLNKRKESNCKLKRKEEGKVNEVLQKEKNCENGNLMKQIHVKSDKLARKLNVDTEMERHLVECVDHQTALNRLVSDYEEIFNPTFIIQLLANLGISGILALYLTLNPDKLSNKSQAFVQLLIACLAMLFTYCWMASKLTHQSSELGNSIYHCDWITSSQTFRKHMQIVISRANVPVVISVASYVPMAMMTFTKVNHTAYNNYLALLVVMEKHRTPHISVSLT